MLIAYLVGTNTVIERETFEEIRQTIYDNFPKYEQMAGCYIRDILQFGEKKVTINMEDGSVFVYKIEEKGQK